MKRGGASLFWMKMTVYCFWKGDKKQPEIHWRGKAWEGPVSGEALLFPTHAAAQSWGCWRMSWKLSNQRVERDLIITLMGFPCIKKHKSIIAVCKPQRQDGRQTVIKGEGEEEGPSLTGCLRCAGKHMSTSFAAFFFDSGGRRWADSIATFLSAHLDSRNRGCDLDPCLDSLC